MGLFLGLITCYILIVNTNEAARILAVIPTPSISHQVVFRPLTQELVKRGHHVTIITADPAFPPGKTPANLTEIDVHDIAYDFLRRNTDDIPRGNADDFMSFMQVVVDSFSKTIDVQLEDESVKRLINDKTQKFDLLILEACVRPALVFSHIYKAPVILMSSFTAIFDNYAIMGAPTHPLLYPTTFRHKLSNLTMWDKIKEVYNHYTILNIYHNNRHLEDKILRKHFGPGVPSVTKLQDNVDMMFLNIHPVFAGIQPVPPTVVYTGGLHQKIDKELPTDLKSYLDSSKNGVIYISFGTNTDPTVLAADRIQVMVKAVSQLPYDVLWKWNGDELPGRTENIRISKWLPQSDLLKHPKIKVFVTQGGLQSTDEAISAGVPLVGIPMLGDQWYNVERYVKTQIGVRLDFEDMTVEMFKDTLLKVINNNSYRQNIVKMRSLIRDEIQTPLERAVWWTEYVLRHGGAKHLRSPAANISWAEYLELELVLTLLAGLLLSLVLFIFAVLKIYKLLFKKNVTGTKVKSS